MENIPSGSYRSVAYNGGTWNSDKNNLISTSESNCVVISSKDGTVNPSSDGFGVANNLFNPNETIKFDFYSDDNYQITDCSWGMEKFVDTSATIYYTNGTKEIVTAQKITVEGKHFGYVSASQGRYIDYVEITHMGSDKTRIFPGKFTTATITKSGLTLAADYTVTDNDDDSDSSNASLTLNEKNTLKIDLNTTNNLTASKQLTSTSVLRAVMAAKLSSQLVVPTEDIQTDSQVADETAQVNSETTAVEANSCETADTEVKTDSELKADEDLDLGVFQVTETPITGTDLDDEVFGTIENDNIFGLYGDDTIHGLEGDDVLHGGEGNDSLFGDEGSDVLYGDSGNDLVEGGDGDDILMGGVGDDTLYGNDGNDFLDGGEGRDELYGGEGDDLIAFDSADYLIDGGDGIDILLSNTNVSLNSLLSNTNQEEGPLVKDVEVLLI